MDPDTLVVTASAAGAALGVSGTASLPVKDAYAGLKALVKKRFSRTGRRLRSGSGQDRWRSGGQRRILRRNSRPACSR